MAEAQLYDSERDRQHSPTRTQKGESRMREIFERYLKDVRFTDWEIRVHMDGERPYLQVGFWDFDAELPPAEQACKTYQKGRKWMLSPHMTKSEVIQTAFKAIMTALEHETREK